VPSVIRINHAGLALLLFFTGYLYLAAEIPIDPWALPGDFTANAFPYLAGGLGLTASLLMLLTEALRPTEQNCAPPSLFEHRIYNDRIFSMVAILVIYISLIDVLGFVIASIAFLLIGARKSGAIALGRLLPFAVGVPLILWGLLDLMNIYISPGRLLTAWLHRT
jgi:hypothetical protein